MKTVMLIFILAITSKTNAQSLSRMPDSVRKVIDQNNGVSKGKVNLPIEKYNEDQIKSKLIKLALQSAQIAAADANISIAEIERRKANSSL